MTKKWQDQARGGLPVRIYAEDGGEGDLIHGSILLINKWAIHSWHKDGTSCEHGPSKLDLIPVEPLKEIIEAKVVESELHGPIIAEPGLNGSTIYVSGFNSEWLGKKVKITIEEIVE